MKKYDIIVIGGGHAGVEASLAAAKMGKKTLLITMLIEQIGAVSCNPAIGGLAKGHLVKELDALGGAMGEFTDLVGIQYRILNQSKGPAVRGSRAQIDMDAWRIHAKDTLLNTDNLDVIQECVSSLIIEQNKVKGVRTTLQNAYTAKKTILTTGTFLNGLIHIGEQQQKAGRFGEFASDELGEFLRTTGLKIGRLKTGTCPRIDAKSIDFDALEIQGGDETPVPFSFATSQKEFQKTQLPCYIAYTNEKTHNIIKDNFGRAPLFTGQIKGVGPRYCPSIEDKINRFGDKDRHHLFVEPQNQEATEYYINGLSTSLPPDVQRDFVRSIEGLQNAKITRYGYAIEYDYIEPTELTHDLQTRKIKGLFCAGQINGTTGYEEAAAQGLMASINACLAIDKKEPFILRRDEAYIGVLIDDLVTKGTKEPYRMFTSRAEYRLLLREDNADVRLRGYGFTLGLVDEKKHLHVKDKIQKIKKELTYLNQTHLTPSKENIQILADIGEEKITDKVSLQKIIARKSMTLPKMIALAPHLKTHSDEVLTQILVECKYQNYIQKQEAQISVMKKMLSVKIPADMDFASISGLSNEVVEKLKTHAPQTLHAASMISGITPASLDILHIYIKMWSSNVPKSK